MDLAAQGKSFQQLYGGYFPVRSDFTNKANGTPLALDSGHQNADALGEQIPSPVFWLRSQSAAGMYQVINGQLTNTIASAFTGASAHIPAMVGGAGVTTIGGEFVLHPGINPDGTLSPSQGADGSVALPIWNGVPIYYQGQIPAASPMAISSVSHLVVTRWAWFISKYYNGLAPVMASGTFASPLKADGATALSVKAVVDPAVNTNTLYLPDGSVHVVTDTITSYSGQTLPLIGAYAAKCVVADWEVYQNDPTEDDKAAWLNIFAS